VTLTAIPLGPLQRQMLSAVMISPLCTKLEVGLQRLEYIASLRDPSKHVRRLLGTVAFGTSRTDPGGRVYPRPPRLVHSGPAWVRSKLDLLCVCVIRLPSSLYQM